MFNFAMGFVTAWVLMFIAFVAIILWCLCDAKVKVPRHPSEESERER